MVLEQSAKAGRIYESFGKPGCGVEWAQSQLPGIWEPVWRHDLKREVDEAIERLQNDPSFINNNSYP